MKNKKEKKDTFNCDSVQDEKNQVLTTNIWLDQEWKDELLTWNPKEFNGITKLLVPCEKLWLPDIVLYNRYISVHFHF